MTERCKQNPCCGDLINCSQLNQWKSRAFDAAAEQAKKDQETFRDTLKTWRPGSPIKATAPVAPTPETDRLVGRLFGDPNRKLVGFNVWRGSRPTTPEELAAAINRALDQAEAETGRSLLRAATQPPDVDGKTPVDVRGWKPRGMA